MSTIRCPACNAANRNRARFCAACGATLPRFCATCGSPLPAASQSCLKCGAPAQPPAGLDRDPDGLLLPGVILEGRYCIARLLGKGGYACVYLAHDVSRQNRPCAVKELTGSSPEEQRQFEREAGLLHSLRHPRLVRVTDYFQTDAGDMFLVMDYIPGQDLEQHLAQAVGFLPENQVVGWALQVCDVLEYMHGWVDPKTGQPSPVIHRDIKPGNLKLQPDGTIIVIDLGIAKVKLPSVRTTVGARAVSAPYSPVEQYGQGTDERSDIYALGATLYELATGQLPPEAPARQTERLVPPRQINPALSLGLEQAILCALQLNPADRFQTVPGMRAALSRCAASAARASGSIHHPLTSTTTPPSSPQPAAPAPQPPSSRRLPAWVWPTIRSASPVVILGAVILGIVLALWQSGRHPAEPTPSATQPAMALLSATPRPTRTPPPTATPAPTSAPPPTATPTPTATATPTQTAAPTPTPFQSVRVRLKTVHGRYVSAMGADDNWLLRAETETIGDPCQEFTLLCLEGGKIALQTCHKTDAGNPRYVTPLGADFDWQLKAQTNEMKSWEEFTLLDPGTGQPDTIQPRSCSDVIQSLQQGHQVTVAFQTWHTKEGKNRLVTAMDAGWELPWILRAETNQLLASEIFTMTSAP